MRPKFCRKLLKSSKVKANTNKIQKNGKSEIFIL